MPGQQVCSKYLVVNAPAAPPPAVDAEINYNIFDPGLRADPYRTYRRLREQGPLIHNPALGFWMATSYDPCQAILRDPLTFSSARLGIDPIRDFLQAPTMLFSDPPDHERLRAPVQRAFTPRSVAALEPRARQVTNDLLSDWGGTGGFAVVDRLSYPLPVIVIAELLGIATEDREKFRRWSDAAVGFNGLGEGAPPLEELGELRAYLERAIERASREPGDDLIHRLVAANEDGTMSDAELLASCVLLLVAGNETTTKLISNAVLQLARHPDQRRLLVDDPDLVAGAVEELLRFDGTVQSTFRIVTKETELEGVELVPGTMVLVMVASANRDPARFADPDSFDVTRGNAREHLGLGFGIHHCLGANLARLETRVAIEGLLDVAPDFVVDDPHLEYGPNFFLRGLERLTITARRA